MQKVRIGIIGATGYSGRELLRILEKHRKVEITLVSSRAEKGKKVIEYFPFLKKDYNNLLFSDVDLNEITEKCDLVFFATPSGTAKDLAPELYHRKIKIIDISGDFRLSTKEDYQKWYGFEHPYPEFLNEVVYCIPEINRKEAIQASFISNPGCYPTSILLPLKPVLTIIQPQCIIIDAKSGVSGAGKKISADYLFSEIDENFYPYKINGTHQHIPEIEKYLSKWTNQKIQVSFSPHLLPLDRGILSTIYIPFVENELYEKAILELEKTYHNELFVKVFDNRLPKIKDTLFTNQCHIGYQYDKRTKTMILVSVIDNLMKGASGQAVQNMNIMLGYNEEEGLC